MPWFANVPISEPIRGTFVEDYNFNGIGWDQKLGFFIPVEEEFDQTIPPYRTADPARTKRLDR
jgi:hypothetical protein